MAYKPLTYAQFEYLLQELGYCRIPSREDAMLFKNAAFDALKVLPVANGDAIVQQRHLVGLRKTSIEKGIVEEDEFDELLRKARALDFIKAA